MKLKFSLLLLFFLSGISPSSLIACSCLNISTFCEAWQLDIAQPEYVEQFVVVRGTIEEIMNRDGFSTYTRFTVNESFHNPDHRTEIILAEGIHSCMQDISYIPMGTELIIHASIFVFEGDTFFSVGSCEVPPLRVEGDRVSGSISHQVSSLTLSEFRNLPSCLSNQLNIKTSFSSREKILFIDILDATKGDVFLTLYDLIGRCIGRQKLEFTKPTDFEWPLGYLPSGVFILQVVNGNEKVIKSLYAFENRN